MPLSMESLLNDRLTAVTADGNDANLINVYNHLRSFESDYDRAQSTLRTIASAWILAAIGAIGLVIQAESSNTPTLSHEIAAPLRQAVLLVATLGLASLWFIDQRIYQRLLHAVYSLGCHIELTTTKLLPIRPRLYLLNFDITNHLGWFYRAPLLVLLAAAIVSLLQAVFGLQATVDALLLNHEAPVMQSPHLWTLAGVITLIHLAFFFWLWKQAADWPSLDAQLPRELVATRKLQPLTPPSSPDSRSRP